jgi:hypothetical protein
MIGGSNRALLAPWPISTEEETDASTPDFSSLLLKVFFVSLCLTTQDLQDRPK